MTVRIATDKDAAALTGLILEFRDYLGATRPSKSELMTYLPIALADAATEFCLVISDRGVALGYSHCRFFPSVWASAVEAHLEDLFVVASARREGAGNQLLAFVVERASERGAASIGLLTNENNEPARAFYRQAGFKPAAEALWNDGREVSWVRSIPFGARPTL